AFAPWVLYATPRMFSWRSEAATPPLFFTQFYFATLTVGRPTFDSMQLAFVGLYLAVMLVGVIVLFRNRRGEPTARPYRALLLAGILTPALVVFVLALPFHDFGRPLAARYLVMLAACFYVLAAWGAVRLGRWRTWAVVGVMVGVALWGMSNIAVGAIRRDEFYSASSLLHDLVGLPADVVILHNDRTWTTFAAAYDRPFEVTRQSQPMTPEYADYLLPQWWDRAGVVWVVETPYARESDPDSRLDAWFSERAVDRYRWTFDETTVTAYVRNRPVIALHTAIWYPHNQYLAGVNLIGSEIPLRRYAIGDSVHIALYWHTSPADAFTVQIRQGEQVIPFSVEPLQTQRDVGVTRQHISLPLLPDTPAGRYTVELLNGGEISLLGEIEVVQLRQTPTVTAAEIATPTDIPFGEQVTLIGYTAGEFRAGQTYPITLYWHTASPITERYKVSVFWLGEAFNPQSNNPLWGQSDGEPQGWQFPTTLWPPNTLIADPHTLVIPANVPHGNYQLGVVMYRVSDGQRLPVNSGDIAILEQITLP
ncbi:MAG: hypothetical protein ACOYL5_15105, partial [Phototrophicaceae bacterium]